MSDFELPQVSPWDPQHGDLGAQHGVAPQQPSVGEPLQWPTPETPQQLAAAGWQVCPKCKNFWISPDTKAKLQNAGGYFTCPKCKLTSDLLEHLPWHGVEEPDYYPRKGSGGGTAIGLPMDDVAQIAENIVQEMKEIPGYGPITWWHSGPAAGGQGQSSLDGTTTEWGIEVKGQVYDAQGHFWDPRSGKDPQAGERKMQTAAEMSLKGVLGVLVLMNFRTDKADVYVKEMPGSAWTDAQGRTRNGIVKWHKRTGSKVASDIPFANPYKDPHSDTPGPYSLSNYYESPQPLDHKAPEPAPF